jgi:senataxin
MAEVAVPAIHELKALPEGTHWFCSKTSDDDTDRCYEEDLTPQDLQSETEDERRRRQAKVETVSKRKKTVLNALQIFAFDGEEAVAFQKDVLARLEHLMQTCDVCVRTYHAARAELVERLEADYDTEDVVAFMDKFDGINVERIKRGLQHAERQLLHLTADRRRVGSLDPEGLYALFEAMNCEPYLRNEQLLRDTFDQPFSLVQTNKKLRLPTYLPAFTYFIFNQDKERNEWAQHAWSKLNRPPTTHEFDFMIRKPLDLALRRVKLDQLEVSFLPDFWYGVSVVVAKLTPDLTTHSLRPIEPNLHRLALDNFSLKEIDIATLGDLASTWKTLIEKSPEAFWDSMRSIPPKAIIEQVFRSPALHRVLLRPDEEGAPRLEDVFAWVRPFLESVKANQVAACGALVREFVARSKNDHFDREARSHCFTMALHVIKSTLQGMNKPPSFETYVGSAVASEMLDQVTEHLGLILEYARGVSNGVAPPEDAATALSIVENAVALDCLTLVMDRKAVQSQKPRGHTAPKKSEEFWNRLTRGITSKDQALATKILHGTRELIGLEKFSSEFSPRSADDPKQFGQAYDTKCVQLSTFLEKISDFPQYQLAGLFKTPETAESIVHILFSSDVSVRQGAVEILKTTADKTDRLDAITAVLDPAFHSFLTAFTISIGEISGKIIFTPMSGMIKLCTDVVDALCNSSNGLLRMKNLVSEETDATRAFWRQLWLVLTTIFENMEGWGTQGHDKQHMMDFCRDTMQFADMLFDQYSVFLSAIESDYADDKSNREQARKLLQHPRDSMNTMVRWLRLRDDFLVEKILTLVTSLLARLSKSKVDASEAALDYIEEVSTRKIRTNLKDTQLAQLRDAIDKYSDRRVARHAAEEKKKAAKQTSLNAWATSGRSREQAIDIDSDQDAAHKRVISDATKGAERYKKLQEQNKLGKRKKPPPPKVNPAMDAKQKAEFIRKRKAEEEEAKRKRAEAAAAARGNVPGPGSALNSLGVATKDHSMKGQGVMVDSDEDSDEEEEDESDDDLDKELFGPTKKSSRPANAMSAAAAAKLLPKGPVKVRRIQRSAKDMRARLAPDLSKLHQEILSWDYFHDGYYPPGSRADVYQQVPKSLQDPGTYKNIFQPLLVLETWRKICTDKDQESQSRPYEIKVISRASVDAFVEVNTSIPQTDQQRLEVSEGDLVLLSNARDPRNSPDSPSCLGRIHKVQRKKQHIEVLYRIIPGNKFISQINGGVTMRALKVESLITVEREYGALMGLQYYDLCDYILQAAPSKLLKYGESTLRPLMDNYQLNQAQAKAVKSALDNDAFTLIQGYVLYSPPL